MLIETNYRNRKKSLYSCDRCGREVYAADVHAIYEKNDRGSVVRTTDLCKHCRRLWRAFLSKQV